MGFVVGVAGNKNTGKTEFSMKLKEELEGMGYNVVFVNFADAMKRITTKLLDIDLDTLEELKREEEEGYVCVKGKDGALPTTTIRKFLQTLGQTLKDELDSKFVWVDIAFNEIDKVFEDNPMSVAIIGDVRFPFEGASITGTYGVDSLLVKIERETGMEDSHVSEQYIKDIDPDVLINNNESLEELYTQAKFTANLVKELHEANGQ